MRSHYLCGIFVNAWEPEDLKFLNFVARTFHIPKDIDDELRMMAIKNHVRFSDMAILAIR